MLNTDVNQFTEAVLSRMCEEHGVERMKFAHFVPQIVIAFDTEHEISTEQLDSLIHGDGDAGVPVELQKLFPALNAIALLPYSGDDEVEEEIEEDDDDDEDVEEEDEGD